MGKSQRVKGHSWEREVAKRLRHLDPNAKRALEYQEGLGVDISTTLPFSIQNKCGAKPPFLDALDEATEHSKGKGRYPVAVVKVDRRGEYALMHLEDWLEIITEWWRYRIA